MYIDAAPGTIRAGPQDDGIYVVDAENKISYDDSGTWPPYAGPRHPPAEPDSFGHFDHITPKDAEFSSATVFATIRLVLTIWEHYLGRKVRWYFRDTYPRLEVIPRVLLEKNAVSKFGYIECGFKNPKTRFGPYCQNFDVVAHEVGHIILKDVIGNPPYRAVAFRAHEEAAADLVAMIALLHFKSVVKHLLQETKGNLYSVNVLSRTGELSKATQIRESFRRAIPRRLAEDSYDALGEDILDLQPAFAKHFKKKEEAFEAALLGARDEFARLLARTWAKTSMSDLTYPRVIDDMITADLELHRGRNIAIIRDSFYWREILPKKGP